MSEDAASNFPKPPHIAAVVTLKDTDDIEILAWRAFARSIESSFQYVARPGGLSEKQVDAISTLKDCTDASLIMWLNIARSSQQPASSRVSQTTLKDYFKVSKAPLRGRRKPLAKSRSTDLSADIRPPAHYITPNPYSTLNTKTGGKLSGQGSHDFVTRSVKSRVTTTGNPYWCTICTEARSYKNRDDWKKHEKKHEIKFVCLRTGPIDAIKGEPRCVFCGILSPDKEHLEKHNIRSCTSETNGTKSFKRRYDIIAHVEQAHGALDGKKLAEKWRCSETKQAWSCGFCVFYFPTFSDRLKHLDKEHFTKHQHVHDWSLTNVIHGLLLQPGVREAWQKLVDLLCLASSGFSWTPTAGKDLQYKLGIGPTAERTADTLAQLAYDSAVHDWASLGCVGHSVTPNFCDSLFAAGPGPSNFHPQGIMLPQVEVRQQQTTLTTAASFEAATSGAEAIGNPLHPDLHYPNDLPQPHFSPQLAFDFFPEVSCAEATDADGELTLICSGI